MLGGEWYGVLDSAMCSHRGAVEQRRVKQGHRLGNNASKVNSDLSISEMLE